LDALVEKCLHCGTPLKEPKLKGFCTYSCRGQHSVEALNGPKYQGAYLGSKNTRKTKALQRLRRASIAGIAFERSNSVTIRIDQPHRKAVGWLMEVAWPAETKKQRWVACVGDHRSEPLTLDETKTVARSLLSTKVRAEPRDWIEELNQTAANEVDRAEIARQRRKWPVDLMGGKRGKHEEERQLGQFILDTERVLTDEDKAASEALRDNVQPEYYEDGHPKLPDFLNRRKPKLALVVDNPIPQPATEAA
jgi:hypothetical protein